ncbi:DUF192 domain-containing protein [Alteraurantiacibacter buctensis]|uniref:DUF192 domain-containing protein n=1 Tax=Alteraurantiacibacter buctensis TaxID=1503981 RepID=A0A844YSQ2_9SPHN|nr:DUF192 domain-containing protein [Alteraurantiacibacter buctensis]MXO70112.1 DUF192 domain-containing protein [Alteraurantiacibacter buctensis]
MARGNRLKLLGAGVALALAACSTQGSADAATATASAEPSVHPVSGLRVIPLTVTTTTGQRHAFRVEVAATGAEQQRGLMFRTEMGPDEGMIFPFSQVRMASFWMRNTVIPLDIIFIGPDNRVINIAANAVPYSEESRPSTAPAAAVLELNGGRAAQLGIGPGALVEW